MSVCWCDYNCCEVYEVNTESGIYKCKLSDDMKHTLPCDDCDDFEERNEEFCEEQGNEE